MCVSPMRPELLSPCRHCFPHLLEPVWCFLNVCQPVIRRRKSIPPEMARNSAHTRFPECLTFLGVHAEINPAWDCPGRKIVITVQKSAIVPFTLIVTFIDPVVLTTKNVKSEYIDSFKTPNNKSPKRNGHLPKTSKTTKKILGLGHLHVMTCGAIIIQDIGSRLKEFLQNLGVELKQQ